MSITNELRSWAEGNALRAGMSLRTARDQALVIADRIDAEHERAVMSAMNDALYHANDESMAELGWVRLPKDADGKVWHVGDFAVGEINPRNPKAIERMIWYGPDSGWQLETNTIIYPCPDRPRHHHAPTVEDVLREFALKVAGEECMTMRTGVVEEYASKLRLARSDAS